MSNNEIDAPIINSPYEEPTAHWFITESDPPEKKTGRRPAIVFPNEMQRNKWEIDDSILAISDDYPAVYELVVVTQIREAVREWREAGYPRVTKITSTLLDFWRDPSRDRKLFFTQLEAAETAIFLLEAGARRRDLLSGIKVPQEIAPDEKEYFKRYAFKMATGSGKSTVMGMLAAWSILNKVHDRKSKIHTDAVLIVAPNVTIRSRLQELDPREGEASLYATRKLVPPDLLGDLQQGKLIIRNWHVFEAQKIQKVGTDTSPVVKRGVERAVFETIRIGEESGKKVRGVRTMTQAEFDMEVNAGRVFIKKGPYHSSREEEFYDVESLQYVESESMPCHLKENMKSLSRGSTTM